MLEFLGDERLRRQCNSELCSRSSGSAVDSLRAVCDALPVTGLSNDGCDNLPALDVEHCSTMSADCLDSLQAPDAVHCSTMSVDCLGNLRAVGGVHLLMKIVVGPDNPQAIVDGGFAKTGGGRPWAALLVYAAMVSQTS